MQTAEVDISCRESVEQLARQARSPGEVTGLIQAAGGAPSQANPQTILRVDLYGNALVLEQFGQVMVPGGAGLVIASQSGHRLEALSEAQNRAQALIPAEELLGLDYLQPERVTDSLYACQLSKRGNSLRAKAEAVRWGKRGVTASYWFGPLHPSTPYTLLG